MSNYITFNGIRSDALGLAIEHYPKMNRPARKYTVADVPGRNGSAYILQDAWTEVLQSYEISAKSPVATFKNVAEWLNSANGYAILQDSYDPTIYRMAVCVNAFDVETALNRAGRALVQFNCRPERFMVASSIEVTSTKNVSNPTSHVAHPLIEITGQGYPSMLDISSRSDVAYDYSPGPTIHGLTYSSSALNFVGLYAEYTANGILRCAGHSAYVLNHSVSSNTLTVETVQSHIGVAMNVPAQPNTTYSLSAKNLSTSTAAGLIQIICGNGGATGSLITKLYEKTIPINQTGNFTFTTGSQTQWIILNFGSASESTQTIKFDSIQLNMGDTAQNFLPYSNSTASSFTFGDCIVNLSELYDYMYLDCESMNAYREPGENMNPLVTITDLYGNPAVKFPRLETGTTSVALTGTDWITKLTITPRFWTL